MAKFGIGQAVRRVEDQRFVIGQGRYVDDIRLAGECHGVTVLSPHAHARIKSIDLSKAKAAPGVLCVLTGADAVAEKLGAMTAHLMPEDFGAPKGHRTFQPLLVADKVRCVGDRVAFVVAETFAQARDAAEMITVDYEPLPAVANIEDAAKEGAPKVWEDNASGNIAFRLMFGSQEATDAAFAKAKHVVKLRVENNRLSPVSMEPRVAIGDYDAANDFYTLYTASQIRTVRGWNCPTSFMCRRTTSVWFRPTSAAGSGSRAGSSPTTHWWCGPRASSSDRCDGSQAAASRCRPITMGARWSTTASLRSTNTARSWAPQQKPVPDGRLLRRRGARGRCVLAAVRAAGLRHPDHAHHVARPVHEHVAKRPLSRRRPARSRLLYGAADRARGP